MLLNVLDSMQKKAISMFTKKMKFFRKSVLRKKTRSFKKKKSEFLNNSRSIFLVVSEATVSDLPCAHHKILKIPQAYALLAAVFWQGSSSGSRNGSWENIGNFPSEFHVILGYWQHVSGILRSTFCGMMMRIVNNDGGFSAVMVVP